MTFPVHDGLAGGFAQIGKSPLRRCLSHHCRYDAAFSASPTVRAYGLVTCQADRDWKLTPKAPG